MYLVIFLGVLLSLSSALSFFFKRKFEEVLPVGIMGIIMILYIFGIFNHLLFGVYVILILSVLSLVYSIYHILKLRSETFKRVLTPGFVVFLCFMIFIWWAHRGRVITLWDEFSHWGLTVKNMVVLDVLGNQNIATTTFKSYPPATALLQYFMQKMSGVFIEANLYRAVNIFAFSMLLPVFKIVSWKNIKNIMYLTFIVLVIPLTFYYEFYHTIYVDAILGVIFGYVLYSYFSNKLNIFNLISVSLGLSMLILTKESGFGLAIIALIIILVDMIAYNRHQIKSFISQHKIMASIWLSLPLIFIVFSKFSWSIYLKVSNTINYWDNGGINLSNILTLYSDEVPAYRKQTMLNFFNALFTDKMSGFMIDITFVGMVIIISLLGIILVHFTSEHQKSKVKMSLRLLFIGGVIYTTSLLFIYLFTYDEAEATGLASLLRYLGTYLTGVLIFISYMLLTVLSKIKLKYEIFVYPIASMLLLVMVNVKPLINTTLLAPYYIDQTNELRAPYLSMERIIDWVDSENEKVFLVAQNNRSGHLTARYILTPIHINSYDYSLGEPYGLSDPYTWNLSLQEWSERLQGYDYVYLYQIDQQFIDQYGSLFDSVEAIKNDGFYKINKTDTNLKLTIIE